MTCSERFVCVCQSHVHMTSDAKPANCFRQPNFSWLLHDTLFSLQHITSPPIMMLYLSYQCPVHSFTAALCSPRSCVTAACCCWQLLKSHTSCRLKWNWCSPLPELAYLESTHHTRIFDIWQVIMTYDELWLVAVVVALSKGGSWF